MLRNLQSNAFGMQEQCFWMLGAMLLASESNAFGCWELCSWRLKAMLKQFQVYSF